MGEFEVYRGYLFVLAEGRMDDRLRDLADPMEFVEAVLTRVELGDAARPRGGRTDVRSWLRGLLAQEIIDLALGVGAVSGTERAARRSLETALAASSERLAMLLTDQDQEGDEVALLDLSDRIAGLETEERRAVEMRVLQNLTVEEIAARMGRTTRAMAGVLRKVLAWVRSLDD